MEKSKTTAQMLKFSDSSKRESVLLALKCIGCAAISLLLSRAKLFNSLSPFGLAFAAACPKKYSAAAAFGAAAGYLLTLSSTASVRYIACVAGTALIMWFVRRAGQERKAMRIASPAAALCCASTGVAVLLAQGFSVNGVLSFLCDCVLAGGMTYFFSQTAQSIEKKENPLFSGRRTVICSVISCCAFLMSFADISLMNFNPARMAGAFLIMLFACLMRESGGAFAGICAGTALGAACGYIPLGGLFAAAGLLGGMFCPFGQLGIAAAFVSTCGLHAVISPSAEGIAVIAESAVAAVVFVLIPKNKLETLRLKISPKVTVTADASREKLCTKLENARTALCDVSACVETVSRELSKISVDTPDMIRARVKQSVCSGCPAEQSCLAENSQVREQAFANINTVLREEGHVVPGDFEPQFQKVCVRQSRLAEGFNRVFTDSTAAVSAGAKTRQLRQVIADQFGSMADILGEISGDMAREPVLMTGETQAARDILEGLGISVTGCECVRKTNGRICLEAKTDALPEGMALSEVVSALRKGLGIRLSYPAVRDTEDGVSLTFDEKPSFGFDLGAVQKTSGESKLCGDYFECFRNADGSDMIVISDGMGTGGRAAVDSAMAANLFSTLIRAGLSCEAALKITNSALLAKSEEETLSTLDVARLDPYSGQVSLYKAGAAPCFVLRKGRTAVLEQTSLPAGILRDIHFASAQTELTQGDILLMVSDGVLVDDGEWIHKALRSWRGDAQGLAEYICALSERRRGAGRADDITVICAAVHAAEN